MLFEIRIVSTIERPALQGCRPCKSLFFVFFFTLVTSPRRSLSVKLSDTRVYEPRATRCKVAVDASHSLQACRRYRSTSPMIKRPPPYDHHRALGIGSLEEAVSYERGNPVQGCRRYKDSIQGCPVSLLLLYYFQA